MGVSVEASSNGVRRESEEAKGLLLNEQTSLLIETIKLNRCPFLRLLKSPQSTLCGRRPHLHSELGN